MTLEMPTTIDYRANWDFKLITKLSFNSDEIHINLITSIIFILQVLEEDALPRNYEILFQEIRNYA